MSNIFNFPGVIFALSFLLLWVAARTGAFLGQKRPLQGETERDDFNIVLTASLTLLGLIIGFSFSMAISRYDLRKNYEEAEANAVGTEYVRAGLLPAPEGTRVRELLKQYLDQRVLFYTTADAARLAPIKTRTSQLENDLWAAVEAPAATQPTPVVALAVSGMNDVLNSEGYTQAAWWNRIPIAAWILMTVIAVCCNLLTGYASLRPESHRVLFLVVPLVIAISFFLVADIDSPIGGITRVGAPNLLSLSQSLQPVQ